MFLTHEVALCFNCGRQKQTNQTSLSVCSVQVRRAGLGVTTLPGVEILHVEQPCGNVAEVCYFGSYVTNAEKCVKEFIFGGKGKKWHSG